MRNGSSAARTTRRALDKVIWSGGIHGAPYHPLDDRLEERHRERADRSSAFYDTFYWPDNATVTVSATSSRGGHSNS